MEEFVEDYKVVEAGSPFLLQTRVLALLDDDYVPQGGICYAEGTFYQVMVLFGEGEGE